MLVTKFLEYNLSFKLVSYIMLDFLLYKRNRFKVIEFYQLNTDEKGYKIRQIALKLILIFWNDIFNHFNLKYS